MVLFVVANGSVNEMADSGFQKIEHESFKFQFICIVNKSLKRLMENDGEGSLGNQLSML